MAGHIHYDIKAIAQSDFGLSAFGDFGESSFSTFMSTDKHLERFVYTESAFASLLETLEKQRQSSALISTTSLLSMTRTTLAAIANFFGAVVCVREEESLWPQVRIYYQQAEALWVCMHQLGIDVAAILIPHLYRLLERLSLNDVILLIASIHAFLLDTYNVPSDVLYALEKHVKPMTGMLSQLSLFTTTVVTTISFHMGYRIFRMVSEQDMMASHMSLTMAMQSVPDRYFLYVIDTLSYVVVQPLWRRLRGFLHLQKDGLSSDFLIRVFLNYYMVAYLRSFADDLYDEHKEDMLKECCDEDQLIEMLQKSSRCLQTLCMEKQIPDKLVYHMLCFFMSLKSPLSTERLITTVLPVVSLDVFMHFQSEWPENQPLAVQHIINILSTFDVSDRDYLWEYIDQEFWTACAGLPKVWLSSLEVFWHSDSDFYKQVFSPALMEVDKKFRARYQNTEMLLFDVSLSDSTALILGVYALCINTYGKEHHYTIRVLNLIKPIQQAFTNYTSEIRFGDRVSVSVMSFMVRTLYLLSPYSPMISIMEEAVSRRKKTVTQFSEHKKLLFFLVNIDKRFMTQYRALIRPVLKDKYLFDEVFWKKIIRLTTKYATKQKIAITIYGDMLTFFMMCAVFFVNEDIAMSNWVSAWPDSVFESCFLGLQEDQMVMPLLSAIALFQRDALSLLGHGLFRSVIHFFRFVQSVKKVLHKEAKRRLKERVESVLQMSRVLLTDMSIDHLYQKMMLSQKEYDRFHAIHLSYQALIHFARHLSLQIEGDPLFILRSHEMPTGYFFDMSSLSDESIFQLRKFFQTLGLRHYLSVFDDSFNKIVSSFKTEVYQHYQHAFHALVQRNLEEYLKHIFQFTKKMSLLITVKDKPLQAYDQDYEISMQSYFNQLQMSVDVQDVRFALVFLRDSTALMIRVYIDFYAQIKEKEFPKESYWMSTLAQVVWPVLDKTLHVFLGLKHSDVRQLDISLESFSQEHMQLICRALSLRLSDVEGFLTEYRGRPLKLSRNLKC